MTPTKIIVHCSATDEHTQDNIYAIKYLHEMPKQKPIKWGEYSTHGKNFSDIGYHYFIDKAGKVHKGRAESVVGAHCKGQNRDSIGICVSGMSQFTKEQFSTLKILLRDLIQEYQIWGENIYGHNEFNPNKVCPGFDVKEIVKDII